MSNSTLRESMIAELCFRPEGMFLLGKVPTKFVTVGYTPARYTDAELALLVAFTQARQASYRARCGEASLDWADNFISIEKDTDFDTVRWGRKRNSWREGVMHSPSLPEALATFWADQYNDEMVGDIVLLRTGALAEVTSIIPYEDRAPDNITDNFMIYGLVDGMGRAMGQYDREVIMSARSVEALGDQMRMAMAHRIEGSHSADDVSKDVSRAAISDDNEPEALMQMWSRRILCHEEQQQLVKCNS